MIQSTIEILVGGDLILLGLALCQVALPLSGLRPVYRMHTPSSERSFIMRPAVPVHVKEDVEIPSLLAEFRMGPTFWSRVSSLEVSYWQVRRGNRLIIEACWMGMTLLSLSAIVVQLTIELLMGIDLFLLGLILCLVALPLEAACWWRWRLSRMDADTALTLRPGVVFLPGLRLGELNQARALGLRLGESRQGLVMVLHRVVQDILFPEPELDSFPVRLV